MFLSDAVGALKGTAKAITINSHEHFGDLEERLDFPAAWDIHVQNMAGYDAPALGRDEIRRRVQAPIGSRSLQEIAAGKKSAVITFDDLTRPTPTYEVAPLVVEELLAAGVPEDRIIFMGSYGCHCILERDEMVRKLGKEITRRFPCINHNVWDNLKDIGVTRRKNLVKVNQTFDAADVRVTISGVKIHFMAGFGGGAKAVLPGVSSIETIYYNHTVLPSGKPLAGVVPLFNNEVRLDMIDAARMARVDFSVQIVYNGKRRTCGVFAGDIVEAHHAACRMAVKHYCTAKLDNPDIVVCNGYPQVRDTTLGGEWVASVREGGTGVLILQNPQGLSTWHFLKEKVQYKNGRTYFDTLAGPPSMPPAVVHDMHAEINPLPRDVQLIVYSQYLDKQQMVNYPRNTQFAFTWDEVIRHLQARHKADARVAVYPCGPIQHSQTRLDEPSGS
jgi:nickel-dependent lactate racemase